MNAFEDPIVAAVHAARESIFARCGYDHAKFNSHVRDASEQLEREGWTFVNRSGQNQSKPQEPFLVREEPSAKDAE